MKPIPLFEHGKLRLLASLPLPQKAKQTRLLGHAQILSNKSTGNREYKNDETI